MSRVFCGLVLAVILAACGGGPASPSPNPPGAPSASELPAVQLPAPIEPLPPVSGASGLAELLVIQPVVKGVRGTRNGRNIFEYNITFTLKETGGRSGVTIRDVVTQIVDLSMTGPACWREALRVPAGGTLTAFADGRLGYCAPEISSDTPAASIYLSVSFLDDAGGLGAAQGQLAVTW
jgi:hypothetical protein